MKILITGASGMLAKDLIEELKNNELVLVDKDILDITNKEQINKILLETRPEILINTAAYTAVDKAEEEDQKELCMKVNSEGAKYLAEACAKNNIILVHYSTDYIFDGNNKNGYKEDDKTTGATNLYGYSKHKGEENILKISEDFKDFKYYILRISWLYGKNGKNFVKTMLTLSETKLELNIINDQYGSPTYTVDVAKRTKYILENKLEKGIYHTTNESFTTWYELAKEIFRLKNIATKLNPINSDQYPTKAKRPTYSILLNTKIKPKMRNWKEALEEFLKII